MLIKKLMMLFGVVVMVAAFSLIQGCSESGQLTAPKLDGSNQSKKKVESSIIYIGTETLEEMLANLQILEDSGLVSTFTEEQKQEMVDAFLEQQKNRRSAKATGAVVIAYTAHYVWSGHDNDLWLEYKWWAGSPRGYHFETPIWSLYWAIRVCYGGRITNWWWMEGGYQRVTAVVGSCVYVPFGSGFVRHYLRIVTN